MSVWKSDVGGTEVDNAVELMKVKRPEAERTCRKLKSLKETVVVEVRDLN